MDGNVNKCGRGFTNTLTGQQTNTHKHKNNALRRCADASGHITAELNPRENSAETELNASSAWAGAVPANIK